MNCDVLVVGAGAAGIAAAVAAAEANLKVVLLERDGFTGGLATAAMVGTICGLYYRGPRRPRFAVRGFARMFAEALAERSGIAPYTLADEGLHFLPYQPEVFHQLAVSRLKQAGVQLILHMFVSDVKLGEAGIDQVVVNAADQKMTLRAKALVDCSGNAQLSMLAGLELLQQTGYQAGAFVFQVAGLPSLDSKLLALNLIRCIKQGMHDGALPADCERLSIVPGTVYNGTALFKLGLPLPVTTGFLIATELELLARSHSVQIIDYLRCSHDLFRSLTITAMALQVGLRTGPRPVGIEVLEERHVLACNKPDDGVAVGAWPIEQWGAQRKPQMTYFKENDHYLIPSGSLVSRDANNLFFAGRAFSASERAIASARVIGTCLNTGYAAGMLAAAFVAQGDWRAGVDRVRCKQVSGSGS